MTTTELRDAAATFSRALPHASRIAVHLANPGDTAVDAAARAVVEGAVLGRYHFHVRSADDTVELAEIDLVVGTRPPRTPRPGPGWAGRSRRRPRWAGIWPTLPRAT